MPRRWVLWGGLGVVLAVAGTAWSASGTAGQEVAAKHSFSAKDWAALHSAEVAAVSPDGTILYLVTFGDDHGPMHREWWTAAADGSHAAKLDLPEDFSPMGFTRDGHKSLRCLEGEGPWATGDLSGEGWEGGGGAIDCGLAASRD
jgi:hypothetical protein